MRATRTLIQLFLPRMALRRRPTTAATTSAREEQTHVRARVSRACESPELRGRAIAVLNSETIAPAPRRAMPELPSTPHVIVLGESTLVSGPVLAAQAGSEVRP